MTTATTFQRPGDDLVLRIQDDRVPGGPDSTLFVGTREHVAQYWNTLHTADDLWTVQRWDFSKARWRRLDPRERQRFDATCARLLEGVR